MLTGPTPIKGVRYNVQVLLNGWVLSALMWCIGSGLKSVPAGIFDGWINRVGVYFVYAGWGGGLVSLVVFLLLMGKYLHARRLGKVL
ncbi:hypothetical protein PS880_04313 [Pseudomonas fluorescens]|uniref:Uncharacterized protein n=1 Tax=Pseudomonas fluorescens TaxID=294 RepID=A0A5E7N082_PSEFL|nr:hypothetical protein PS880_04313 [Pseudomonas fluorescens]